MKKLCEILRDNKAFTVFTVLVIALLVLASNGGKEEYL